MRYAACNELVHDRPFAEACALIARHGYQGIELAPYSLADDPLRIPPAQAREIRRTIRDAGLECVGLHWLLKAPRGLHITTPDIGVRRRSWEAVRALVDFCREVGGELVVLGSGKQRGTQGISREAATAILREELAGLASHLAQSGVTLLLEPLNDRYDHPDYFCTSSDQAAQICRKIGSERLKMLFDCYHMQIMEGDLIKHIERNIDVIGHFHSAAVPGRGELYQGEVNYPFVLSRVENLGYKGVFGLEYVPSIDDEASLKKTLEYLRT